MYILEIVNVNTKEDKFFEDTDTFKQYESFYEDYIEQFDNRFAKDIYKQQLKTQSIRERLIDGTYRRILRKSFFKSQNACEKYIKDFVSEGLRWDWDETLQQRIWKPEAREEANLARTRWIIENNIIFEYNVLDSQGNFIKCLNSCARKICMVFGECDPENTCENLWQQQGSFVKQDISLHHISVASIKRK